MPREPKNKQPSVEPADPEEGSSGETGGELVPLATTKRPIIPGFSAEQVKHLNAMTTQMATMMDVKLEAQARRQEASQSHLMAVIERALSGSHLPDIEQTSQHPDTQHQYSSPPAQPAIATAKPEIRAESVGYFDPEYQNEKEQGSTNNGPVVNAGKYVYYKDIYVFVDRLKDLAKQQGDIKIRNVVSECLRGSALMWYSIELTELERDLLRDSDLDRWYTTMINRFKIRTSVALSQLIHRSYGMQDLRNNKHPRAFIQEMLHLAKAANLESLDNQLTMIWNQLHVSLRRDIPEPTKYTSLGQFLEHIDSKVSIWHGLAQRPPFQQQQQPHGGNQQANQKPFRYRNQPPEQSRAYMADPDMDGDEDYQEEG